MTKRRGRGRPKNTDLDTSAAIARAALQRFAAQGFDATALREIASDAKVDPALISYRFGGKEGLWKAIVTQAADDLRGALEQALAETRDADAAARLRHSARTFLAYLLARPEVPRLLLRDVSVDNDRAQWLRDALSLPLHQHFFALADAHPDAPAYLKFKVANFIYSAASTVARRDRLVQLVDGIDGDEAFAAALEATLIEDMFGRD